MDGNPIIETARYCGYLLLHWHCKDRVKKNAPTHWTELTQLGSSHNSTPLHNFVRPGKLSLIWGFLLLLSPTHHSECLLPESKMIPYNCVQRLSSTHQDVNWAFCTIIGLFLSTFHTTCDFLSCHPDCFVWMTIGCHIFLLAASPLYASKHFLCHKMVAMEVPQTFH